MDTLPAVRLFIFREVRAVSAPEERPVTGHVLLTYMGDLGEDEMACLT